MSWFKKKITKISAAITLALTLSSCFNDELKHLEKQHHEAKSKLEQTQIEHIKNDELSLKKVIKLLKISKNYEIKADQEFKEDNITSSLPLYQHARTINDKALEILNSIDEDVNNINVSQEIKVDLNELEKTIKQNQSNLFLKHKKAYENRHNELHDIKELKPSKKGIDFILGFEKFEAEAYYCQGNRLTIGYGHTKNVKEGDVIDRTKARELFKEDIKEFRGYLKHYLKGMKFTQQQYDALLSLMFNIGPGNFTKGPVYKNLKAGEFEKAFDAFIKHNTVKGKFSKGSNDRRLKEIKIIKKGIYDIKTFNL